MNDGVVTIMATKRLRRHVALLWSSLVLMSFLSVAATAPVVSPDAIEGVQNITAEQLIELANKIPGLIIIDSRLADDYKDGSIEGAVSLPDVETRCQTLAGHIPRKDSPTVFFCNGIKCGRSFKAIKIALNCGYSKVYWFRGGYEEWLSKGYR